MDMTVVCWRRKKRDKKEADTGKRRQRKEVFLCLGLGVSLVFKTGKELVGGQSMVTMVTSQEGPEEK